MSSAAPRDSTAFEVREALAELGCPVCRLAVRSVGRWLAAVAYEQVNDIQLRNELRAARGFCNVHAHRWLREVHSVLGTSIVYQDLLKAGLRELDADGGRSGGGSGSGSGSGGGGGGRGGLWRALTGAQATSGGGCPACRMQTEAEERYLEALLATVAAEPHVLGSSEGVCLRHARAALRTRGPGVEAVVQQTRAAVQQLLGELDEVIRKEDYRFRHEPRTEAERTAPARAVNRVVGLDGLID
jgi:hypothetical protein